MEEPCWQGLWQNRTQWGPLAVRWRGKAAAVTDREGVAVAPLQFLSLSLGGEEEKEINTHPSGLFVR